MNNKQSAFTILHVPHSSTEIPFEVLPDYDISGAELEIELLRVTDHYTDILFDCCSSRARLIRFPLSVLVVDPVKPPDVIEEPGCLTERGAVALFTSDLKRLRLLGEARRKELLDNIYYPYHAELGAETSAVLLRHGRCFFIDCHSFPSTPLPHEAETSFTRPDICIGTDPFHTPDWLTSSASKLFTKESLNIAVDRPQGGTFVPRGYFGVDPGVIAIRIDVNRRLYMDEITGARSRRFVAFHMILRKVIGALIDRVSSS